MSTESISALYHQLLESWNQRNAHEYAALFDENSHVVGFDGSIMNGRQEIETTLQDIFNHHMTATYVGKIRGVEFLAPDIALLRAVVGMVLRGQSAINPPTNAIQSLVAKQQNGQWRIVLFQNTPAQFHGRPDLAEALTNELRELL